MRTAAAALLILAGCGPVTVAPPKSDPKIDALTARLDQAEKSLAEQGRAIEMLTTTPEPVSIEVPAPTPVDYSAEAGAMVAELSEFEQTRLRGIINRTEAGGKFNYEERDFVASVTRGALTTLLGKDPRDKPIVPPRENPELVESLAKMIAKAKSQ